MYLSVVIVYTEWHNSNVYVKIIEEIDIDEVAMVTVHQANLFY